MSASKPQVSAIREVNAQQAPMAPVIESSAVNTARVSSALATSFAVRFELKLRPQKLETSTHR
jgi:hypothetical protein